MADSKISQLTGATTPLAGTEVVPLVQSGTTKKVAVSDLTAGRAVSALSVTAATIGGGSGSALSLQSNGTTGATMDTSQNIGFGSTTIDGFYGSGSVATRIAVSYASTSTDCNAAPKGLVVRNDDTTTSNLSMLVFGTQNTGNTPIATAAVWSVNDARTSGFSTGSLHFGTVNGSGVISDRGEFDTAGNLKVANGNLVIGTDGKGIDFSATPGTGTSELLDDYEEGTFTPTVTSASGSLTTVTAAGRYTKIGRMVYINCQATLTDVGTGSGALIFTLPFTPIAAGTGMGRASTLNWNEYQMAGLNGFGIIAIAGNVSLIGVTHTNGYRYAFTAAYEAA
jgi:hypothetical protein